VKPRLVPAGVDPETDPVGYLKPVNELFHDGDLERIGLTIVDMEVDGIARIVKGIGAMRAGRVEAAMDDEAGFGAEVVPKRIKEEKQGAVHP